mgnify:CR=1 FL=1|tara:strand:+ start:4979 stop:5278 length:300 start_codon:yes stop_codon:yes gene_type:complete
MDLYEYILECESESYHFYYSWEAKPDKVVSHFIKNRRAIGDGAIDIVDVFPEPHTRSVVLAAPLHIQTKCGKGMYLPTDFKVNIHTVYRVLFEYFVEDL